MFVVKINNLLSSNRTTLY